MNSIQPKRIGMVCRGEPGDVLVLKRLIEYVGDKAEVILDEKTAHELKKEEQGMKIGEMVVDFLICVGGDGTILRTLHYLKSTTPVLGINMGAIGFLAEVQPENAISVLTRILEGFEVERRERLSVEVSGERMPYAMNEAVVITSKPGKMLHFAIFVDDDELERLRADGVVFATPTGSTAYAMSAGGPIVDPKVDAAIIVPIAPFKLSARPTVVDINTMISLELFGMKEAELVIDGQFYRGIGKEDRISITRGEPAFFVKIRDKHFLKLRDKLRSEDEREMKRLI